MPTKNKLEVKPIKDAIFLFYNGTNTKVGWRLSSIELWHDEYELMEKEFPLLDIMEEYRQVTEDVLLGLKFLTPKERIEASKKFIKYLKPAR